ncbi:hypothetical protein Anapl_11835 [Anas platyrhynchos]|uniref:Uncharacterized protein n=1 Tax=Anas platyrhynchos TaxID=8839 RepID=R0L7U6_ANAPL|nr:hypothetical protein Anapl_11835 [Anas platyrhynchos]
MVSGTHLIVTRSLLWKSYNHVKLRLVQEQAAGCTGPEPDLLFALTQGSCLHGVSTRLWRVAQTQHSASSELQEEPACKYRLSQQQISATRRALQQILLEGVGTSLNSSHHEHLAASCTSLNRMQTLVRAAFTEKGTRKSSCQK